MNRCLVIEPGLVPYQQAWAWQQALVARRQQGLGEDVLLLLEHPPTFTLGRKTDPSNLLVPTAELEAAGCEVVSIDRGGDITFHGPGQLVGYPILQLRPEERDYPGYIRRLEAVLIAALRDVGLTAGRLPGFSGVWWEGEKLAAIGVKISGGVTSHGFALNVTTDLAYFRHIVPCGIADKPVGSVANALGRSGGQPPSFDGLLASVSRHFADVFGRSCERLGPEASAAFLSILPDKTRT